jgi:hypothetical protein
MKTIWIFIIIIIIMGGDSADGIATRYEAGRSKVRIPVRTKFSASVQTGPGAHPAYYTKDTGSFPRVKRQERGVDHPPHLAPSLKKD